MKVAKIVRYAKDVWPWLGTDHLTWKGGVWFFVSFRIFFSDNTRIRIFIFFVTYSANFFSRIFLQVKWSFPYGGHYRATINEWWLQKYVHLKYILWHFKCMSIITIKKISLSLIEFFVGVIIFNQVNQARCDQRLHNKNKNSIIRWLTCNM
jgi:hypothetical protein